MKIQIPSTAARKAQQFDIGIESHPSDAVISKFSESCLKAIPVL